MLTAEEDQKQQAHARELALRRQMAQRAKMASSSQPTGLVGSADISGTAEAVAGEFLKKSVYYIPVIGILIYMLGRILLPDIVKKLSIIELIALIFEQFVFIACALLILLLLIIVGYVVANPGESLLFGVTQGFKFLWGFIFK